MDIDYSKKENWVNPLEAIRKACLDCTCLSPDWVRKCQNTVCPLWAHRFGKEPQTVENELYEFLGMAEEVLEEEWLLDYAGRPSEK